MWSEIQERHRGEVPFDSLTQIGLSNNRPGKKQKQKEGVKTFVCIYLPPFALMDK